jgi:restriction system protein
MWQIEVRHNGLNKYRLIRGTDQYVVEQKAEAQKAAWNEMWRKKVEREQRISNKQSMLEDAHEQTKEAVESIEQLENILLSALKVDSTIKWELLKDSSTFSHLTPSKPQPETIPDPPKETSTLYQPDFGLIDKIFSSRKEQKISNAKELFKKDYKRWEQKKEETLKKNADAEKEYQSQSELWQVEKQNFLDKQIKKNESLEKKKGKYFKKDLKAIFSYCESVLSNSVYPDFFPQKYDLDYNPDTKILIVEFSLPSIDEMPNVKEVKYVQSREELVETYLPESTINKLYDSLIYQTSLRTIHELYKADVIEVLESIVFNGWVESIDKATGKKVNACIISVQANRAEFLAINLSSVDPKLCFKNLKGIGSSKLHSLTPIAPVLTISREDKRFISSYEVADGLDESMNLAAMDWEDFEHLIREVFEKEFAQSGGEVKVTQASRDGGVDAVAFDPDPIRGGKIVIQAKRYTNTVGVSAVRDLFGTVMNEGATKGILVTTADYGPEAYEFAKGKPLTLMNGGNLLYLLEKHGHKANIDLKAAKIILAEKEKNS